MHVDAIDALAIPGVGETDGQLAGVILGLTHVLGQGLVPGFRLDHAPAGSRQRGGVVLTAVAPGIAHVLDLYTGPTVHAFRSASGSAVRRRGR